MPKVKHIAIKSVDNLKGKGYHSGGSARHSPQEQRKMSMEAQNLSNSQVLAGPSAKPPLRTAGKTQEQQRRAELVKNFATGKAQIAGRSRQPKGITDKDLARFEKEKLQRKSITRAQKDAQAKKELSPQQFAQYNKEKARQQKLKNSKSYQALEGYRDSLKASGARFNNLSPKQRAKLNKLSGAVYTDRVNKEYFKTESSGQGPKPAISPKMKPLTAEQKNQFTKLMKANSKPVRKSTMFGQRSTPKRKVDPYGNFAPAQAKAMKTFNKNINIK